MIPEDAYISPVLQDLVKTLSYKREWSMWVGYEESEAGSGGWTFFVVSDTDNSYDPTTRIRVRHGFLIPAASYNRNTWAAWLFDRIRDVETHEAGEFFMLDGVREFAPHHGNGEDPYRVWHMSDYEAARKKAGQT